MSHLTPSEFVDLIDGQLESGRARHLDACEFCRKQFEDVEEALRLSAEFRMPEPSPLFWEHFSSRVRSGVDEAGSSGRSGIRWLNAAPRAALAAAAVLTIMAAGWYLRPVPVGDGPVVGPGGSAEPPAIRADDSSPDAAWEAVRAVAERVDWEDAQAAGLAARPGSIDYALLELDDREREQLMSLLEEELKRAGT